MSQYKEAAVGSTVYFWFAANLTTGAAGDGATPLYDVRAAGAASSAAPTASGTPTLLTHANYTDGLHEIAIDTTGYSVGEYAVFCTLTISTVNPAGFVGSFLVVAASTTSRDLLAAIKAKTDNLPSDPADQSALQTLIEDIPTNSEFAASQAAADDATLAAIAALPTAPTAAAVADAVWDEAIAGHLGAGSTGAALNAAGSAGDPWTTPLPGAYGSGTAGKIVGDNLNATVSSRASQTSVDDLPTNAELATALDPIPTAIENADTLLDRNMATGTDSGSTTVRTPRQALRFLRNKWSISGTTLTVAKEDDSTSSWTAELTTNPSADPITAADPAGP